MEYKLTSKGQFSKRCPDGKRRNFLLFFLNNVEIFKQKIPYDTDYCIGSDMRTDFSNVYLLNGNIYQTRTICEFGLVNDIWGLQSKKTRDVRFPISKIKLSQFNIPKDIKIELTERR